MSGGLSQRWKALSVAGRAVFALAVLALATATAAAVWWTLRDDRQVLFSGLSQPDAASVVKELDRLKVPYSLTEGGSTILVAQDVVYKTRLKLMSQGGLALQGNVGFEMFNNADFGMTDFAQRINYQRAMQGELSRTILGMAEVSSARVHLVLPDGGLFKKTQARPKASVTLGLKSQLKPVQILGVQRLVAAAVPEMEPDAVTVVDQQGQTLSRAAGGPEDSDAGTRFEAKQQAEVYVRRKVAEVMDRALGPGRAIVTVDVTLNTDRVQYTREELLPYSTANGQPVGATTRRRENVQSSGSLPAGKGAEAAPAPAESSTHTVEVDYANGRKVEQVVLGQGNIRRLSVGVLVPPSVGSAELGKLRDMVAMAVGLSEARGDALAINTIDGPVAEAAREEAPAMAEFSASQKTDPTAAPARPWFPAEHVLSWAAALSLIIVALIFLRRHKPAGRLHRLSEAQRDAVLEDVRRWSMEGASKAPTKEG